MRQLSIPTWFLTLSAADMEWPEIIQSNACQQGKIYREWRHCINTMRGEMQVVENQLNHEWSPVFFSIKAQPIGKISDYFIRIEFQARGPSHAHTIIWVKMHHTLPPTRMKKSASLLTEIRQAKLIQNYQDFKSIDIRQHAGATEAADLDFPMLQPRNFRKREGRRVSQQRVCSNVDQRLY